MQSLLFSFTPDTRDRLTTDLWEAGTLGIIEHDRHLQAFFADGPELERILARYPGSTVVDHLCEKPNLQGACMDPVPLGSRFLVIDEGQDVPSHAGRHIIALQSSEAFGSGRHETTQLVTEFLETLDLENKTVSDIGCGSGILSEVARVLGAFTVIACDTHPGSVIVARQQFPRIVCFTGSADSLATHAFDIVIANITARIINLLADELLRIVKPDGVVLLSGFLANAVPERFKPEAVREKNEWLCWLCRPETATFRATTDECSQVQPFHAQWW